MALPSCQHQPCVAIALVLQLQVLGGERRMNSEDNHEYHEVKGDNNTALHLQNIDIDINLKAGVNMLYDNSVKTVLHLYDCSPTCKHVRICCTLASSPLLQAPRKASPTPSLPTILLDFYQNPENSGWLDFHKLRFHIEDMEADPSDNISFYYPHQFQNI